MLPSQSPTELPGGFSIHSPQGYTVLQNHCRTSETTSRPGDLENVPLKLVFDRLAAAFGGAVRWSCMMYAYLHRFPQCQSHYGIISVLQMCSQEAVLCSGGTLSTLWGAGSRSEEPVPVPGPAGWGEGTGQPARAGPHWRWDPAVAE